MADSNSDRVSYVDFEGRTIVDVNALLKVPKVRETIERMSKMHEQQRGKPGVRFVKYLKSKT